MVGASPAKNLGIAALEGPPLILLGVFRVSVFGLWLAELFMHLGTDWIWSPHLGSTPLGFNFVPWVRYLGYRALGSRAALRAMRALFNLGAAQLKDHPQGHDSIHHKRHYKYIIDQR